MNVVDIVREYLKANQYDGLFNECGECACGLADLNPCGELNGDCQPGYKHRCDCGDHDFHIEEKKPTAQELEEQEEEEEEEEDD